MIATTIDWHTYFSLIANGILPDLVKLTIELVIIPVFGMLVRLLFQEMIKRHCKILVKWAGQKIERGSENWATSRLDMVIEQTQKIWWLKWLTKEELEQYIEEAVAEWNKDFQSATASSLKP